MCVRNKEKMKAENDPLMQSTAKHTLAKRRDHSCSLVLSFLMFAVEASIPIESFACLPEMERTPAAYAFHRYEKLGVPYEAAAEMAYPAAKRAKNICVKNLQT